MMLVRACLLHWGAFSSTQFAIINFISLFNGIICLIVHLMTCAHWQRVDISNALHSRSCFDGSYQLASSHLQFDFTRRLAWVCTTCYSWQILEHNSSLILRCNWCQSYFLLHADQFSRWTHSSPPNTSASLTFVCNVIRRTSDSSRFCHHRDSWTHSPSILLSTQSFNEHHFTAFTCRKCATMGPV